MAGLFEKYCVINKTYTISDLIGAGTFGEVYKVHHRKLGSQALKIFYQGVISKSSEVDLFNEAYLLTKFTHKNIVRVYDANEFQHEGKKYYYIAMEHINGNTLGDYLDEHKNIAIDESINIVFDISEGLKQAHKLKPPLVHRDIKPQNILLQKEEGKIVAKVSDFGIAKHLDPITQVTDAAGTVAFMPPEVASNYETTSSDIYSLGIIFYMMLAGQFPFELPKSHASHHSLGDIHQLVVHAKRDIPVPPSSHNTEVPPELDKLVLKMLMPAEDKRYRDAEDLLKALNNYKRLKQKRKDSVIDLDPEIVKNIEQALKLGRQYSTLRDAITLMETAIILSPMDKRKILKKKYQSILANWKKGIIF